MSDFYSGDLYSDFVGTSKFVYDGRRFLPGNWSYYFFYRDGARYQDDVALNYAVGHRTMHWL